MPILQALNIMAAKIELEQGGYTQLSDRQILCWYAGLCDGDIVEFGCNEGYTTMHLAKFAGQGRKVYGIDNISGVVTAPKEMLVQRPTPAGFGRLARALPNVALIDKPSALVTSEMIGDDVRMFFVDGDHSYHGIRTDTIFAWQHMASRRGGYIFWHDYFFYPGDLRSQVWCGVTEFVENEIAPLRQVISFENTRTACVEVTPGELFPVPSSIHMPNELWDKIVGRTLMTREKVEFLFALAHSCLNVSGSFAEIGVWKGGCTKVLCELGFARAKKIHAFDTFTGIPGEKLGTVDGVTPGEFSVNLEEVRTYLVEHRGLELHQGLFPETAVAVPEDEQFAFVHVDSDLGQTTQDALDFFGPRMSQGGIMLFDDYGFNRCQGVAPAVDAYAASHRVEKTTRPCQCALKFVG